MTATTGGPEGRDPAFGTIGTVDDAARAADRRERIASMLQRSGAGPIWIPEESITAIRTERGVAGKAMTHEGILAIRWRLPSGTEIDTGFRADNRAAYAPWLEAV